MTRLLYYSTLLVLFCFPQIVAAQEIFHHPNIKEPLGAKWEWAFKEAARREFTAGFWIGYGIRRLMGEKSQIGHFSDCYGRYSRSLHELLYGQKEFAEESESDDGIRAETLRALERKEQQGKGPMLVKGVAILFACTHSSSGGSRVSKVRISNLSLPVDLAERPLLWLGNAGEEESVALLERMFTDVPTTKLKESVLFAISIHDSSRQAAEFLRRQLKESEEERIRGGSAAWIGLRGQAEDLKLLVEAATTDISRHVREQALFGLSQMPLEEATDALIDLIRNGSTREVRSRAISWLSQRASQKVLPMLNEIVTSDAETGLQKEAVFALSRMKDGRGVKDLIVIARTHKNLEVRRQAIFWLGQTEDQQALDALMEMVRGR